MKKILPDYPSNEIPRSAGRTIRTEMNGLHALATALENGLAEPFTRAVQTLGSITGRVIVTGVGKSGHIGAKIAATLSSTGTPSHFVHPAEANHGDLGMIERDDAIIVLSWSGESAELKGILAYSRRFQIPLVAFTSGADSALAREADLVMLLPKEQEACPHGLAPTTSTLMQLALGDALAVALLEAKGFTAGDFHTFHPGGRLGANLAHVSDVMHTGESVPLVPSGTPAPEAIMTLSVRKFGCVGITGPDGRLIGIVTDGDVARNLGRNLVDQPIDAIMTSQPKTIAPTALASTAMAILNQNSIGALIVTDNTLSPIGIVHFHDLLRIGVA
ncbi:KpsF/GutQ family sugar-phosphate isomerase [Hoeflea sp. YIM 152468]|uniref:KpsF/GutQ family sugar-phosphate isomerase n=1 Tax=Hoeflea sp. YIM 152468 TaxID=3031759 RepID=UPI0023DBC51B|nr:KpsF/GutQ family sugar-phosphate isomerase [Hoeflea sp. YIM 152468]MDF1607890.1 KpsF/GutQ family sugar-phosphate isomerase [Hoeflea sp. YIM 152468]